MKPGGNSPQRSVACKELRKWNPTGTEGKLGKGFLGDAVLRDKVRQEPSTEGSVNIIKQVAAEEQREWT